MTILRIHENAEIKGGSEVYIRDVSTELNNRGHLNLLMFIEGENNFIITWKDEKYSAKESNVQLILNRLLFSIKIDIVHIHGLSNQKIIKFFLHRFRVVRTMHEPRLVCPGYGKFWLSSSKPCSIPWGFHCFKHAYTEKCMRSRMPYKVLKSYLNTRFEVNYASKKYAAILTMSEYIRQEAILGGICPERIICNPHFTKFNLPYIPHQGFEKRFLFVGRLIKHKGINELLEACLSVIKNNSHVYIDIVGNGPLFEDVLNFIKTNQLEKRIIVYSWKSSEEISQLMKTAYAVLFPSIYPEAFGLVGIESAVHSKPVIAFDRGGINTWLKNGYNGYLLKEVSSEKLALAMENLLSNLIEYEILSKNAWEWASSYFTPNRHVDKLIEVYESCINHLSREKFESTL